MPQWMDTIYSTLQKINVERKKGATSRHLPEGLPQDEPALSTTNK